MTQDSKVWKSKAGKPHANRRHGMTNSRAYKSWAHAKGRCYTITDPKYPQYGERGIKMCDRWRDSFENFHIDMGEPPLGMTIERKDVNGDYCPENCMWASLTDQARNKTSNRYVSGFGRNLLMTAWAKLLKTSDSHIFITLKHGHSVEWLAQRRGIEVNFGAKAR